MYTQHDRLSDFSYFIDNYEHFYRMYGHKFIVIQKKSVLGAYNTMKEALNVTIRNHKKGTFIIQECNGNETGYTTYIFHFDI